MPYLALGTRYADNLAALNNLSFSDEELDRIEDILKQ